MNHRKEAYIVNTGRQFFLRLPPREPFLSKEDRKEEVLRGAIIEVRNTSKTSSELLYFELERFCLVWAHHFHIYGDLAR